MSNEKPENQINIELSEEMAEGVYSNLAMIAQQLIINKLAPVPAPNPPAPAKAPVKKTSK